MGFGTLFAQSGFGSVFKFGGGNGCQTEADTGLVLMGHRYYDARIGRFITQDPAGDGDNWYAYADNSPTNAVDPLGLDTTFSFTQSAADQQQDAENLESGSDYEAGDQIKYGSDGSAYFNTADGGVHGDTQVRVSGGSDDSGGGLFDGVGASFGVGFSAVGSALSGGLWNGGAARHDPSFKTSLVLANIGVFAGSAAFGGAEAKGVGELAKVGCFTAGTPVQTEHGAMPIQNIHAGDLVATRSLETQQTEYRKVVRTFQHLAHDTVTVEFADAKTGQVVDTLTATPEHPFYVVGRGMTALGSLGIGTLVVTRAGPSVVVHSLVRQHSAAGVLVYNLEVEGDHTYFVGSANGGEWVHNDCNAAEYLTKELISQSRVIGKGSAVKQAGRLARQYGGNIGNWVKKSSPILEHPETGEDVEIHWFENMKDNIGRVEHKWSFDPW